MDRVIAIIFTLIYLAEGAFTFFLDNGTHKTSSLVIMTVVAIVLIWGADLFLVSKGSAHKNLWLILIGIIIIILMPVAWGFLGK